MDPDAIQEVRRERLKALRDEKYGGRNVDLGRALGHASGATVRQWIDRERPITEKTIGKLEALPGCRGWFNLHAEHIFPKGWSSTATIDNLVVVSADENAAIGVSFFLERMADLIATMTPEQRGRAARLLARLADAPDSRIAREEAIQALTTDTVAAPTWRDAAVEFLAEVRFRRKPLNPETLIRDIDRVHSDRLSQVSAKVARPDLTES